ncbi:ABC transporter permease [Rummeliibacillus sp. G93]|uniref:Spermidine/putrescine ABC transporter permease n=1 Tax=Rummeliibacillus stabekisii TaxID=241244 RepID=A0A143H968_9BACL|nr:MULTISPECIES: ABC transporter permease [Rummeliibacillus]AMW98268.1 spermidine/putrescine ABC transporter permease [Rummeliibacillus stabekisii]MBB5170043.1 spermidine/putrescine transport system permease protein [Rummeliibacillus stabekisii]MCM3315655.1 ABC transporter permease [Rummeliibacillus stabekisii]UQW98227.1 ABC transporter permease [Rummeliibacillus sp. G93]GEL04302.1 spermidine/putrescine ABC transporter permease [Rummeliibacillus stabekisii]
MEKLNKRSKLYLALVFVILYAPILFLVFYSFNSGDSMTNFKSFTFAHYKEVFQDSRLIVILINTVVIALLSALIATIIGTLGSIGIVSIKNRKMRNTVLSLNNILIVSPDVIIGASFLILFTMAGIKLGFMSVLLSHAAFSIPIVVLMVLPKLHEMSSSLIDAALDLGASRRDILTRVILPYVKPGIFAGFFMALTYSLDDFAVTFFVTGNGFSTLSVEIYSMARAGVSLTVNALSGLVFFVTLLLVLGYYFITKRQTRSGAHK